MGIHVKFFASMRDLMGDDRDIENVIIKEHDISNVDDIWNYCAEGKKRSENVLIAVNMDYVGGHTLVKDGDEVAFFPPVTGG
ncbi:MAG: MoaD/ThiS family protein [Gammaproteobacteria bacterium]|nr:MoaD/ThiS family protein [Gammaproteobacteria bacterium]